MKTMNVLDLIQKLAQITEAYGPDVDVYIAGDEEGNYFGSLEETTSFDVAYGKLLIFPYEQADADDLLIEEN